MIKIFSKHFAYKTFKYKRHQSILSLKSFIKIKRTKNNRLIVKLFKIPILSLKIKAKNNAAFISQFSTKSNLAHAQKPLSKLAIFAHYDKQDIIEDYVVDYLKSLREVANNIIFVSDCTLSAQELSKIHGLVAKIIAQKHGEYDFGSYKRGMIFAKTESKNINSTIGKLEDYDQLIMANDSCYLTSSLAPAFKEMSSRKSCDFWGMTQNTEQFLPHIQSYFLVFNKNVFLHQGFFDFFLSVKKEGAKLDIVENYEVGLTQNLLDLGFTKDSLIKKIFSKNITLSEKLFFNSVPKDFPLVKVPLLNRMLWNKAMQEKSF